MGEVVVPMVGFKANFSATISPSLKSPSRLRSIQTREVFVESRVREAARKGDGVRRRERESGRGEIGVGRFATRLFDCPDFDGGNPVLPRRALGGGAISRRRDALIDLPVAVVVDSVAADFGGGGVDGGISVVAIARVRDVAGRFRRRGLADGGVSVVVAVRVLVPRLAAGAAEVFDVFYPSVDGLRNLVVAAVGVDVVVRRVEAAGHPAGCTAKSSTSKFWDEPKFSPSRFE